MNSYRQAVRISCIVLSLTVVKSNEDGDSSSDYARGQSNCVCKPTMRIELMAKEENRPICNNATVNWLFNTALERISKQSEWISEMLQDMKNLEEELGKGHDLLLANEKLIEEIEAEREQSRTELKEKNKRILELEEKLSLAREEKRHCTREGLKEEDHDPDEIKWIQSHRNG